MDWSLPLFRIFGIRVELHWTFLVYMLFSIVNASNKMLEGITMGLLFGSVLLHEFGHSLACRSVGGRATQIILWPLGGLAQCNPPLRPGPSLWTTVCGPLVNVLLMGVAAGVLAAAWPVQGGFPLSLHPLAMVDWDAMRAPEVKPWMVLAAWFYFMNYALFLFNVCFVCYPMDGGRMLHELLWFRFGYLRSLYAACFVGMLVAIGMGVLALTGHLSLMAIGIALLCLMTSGGQFMRLHRAWRAAGSWAALPDPAAADAEPASAPAAATASPSRVPAAVPQEEVQRILAKVAREGLESLSDEERAALGRPSDGR